MELFAFRAINLGPHTRAGLVTPDGSRATAHPYVPFVASELMGAILTTAGLTGTPSACRPLFPQGPRASFYRLKRAFSRRSSSAVD